jgi:hypothetical protein
MAKMGCFEVHLSLVVLEVVLEAEHRTVRFHHSLPSVCGHTFRWRHQTMFGLVDLESRLKCQATAVLVGKEGCSCLEIDLHWWR